VANKRINELEERDYQQAVSNNDYFMVDGESLDEAKKILVSNFASLELVNSGFNTLNASARKIVSDINDFKSKIPTIETGTNNNIRVDLDEDSQVYTFYGSAYDVVSQDDKLKVETATKGYNKTFKISADTYTKPYIDAQLEDLVGVYDINGGNNISVDKESIGDFETNKFVVSLDGITASLNGNYYENVSGSSVVINEDNTAYDRSLSQGINNYAKDYSFAQGTDNSSNFIALSQGQNNSAGNVALAQGSYNLALNNSLSQGIGNSAIDISLAQGRYNYAESGSMALGGYASAYSGSIVYGNPENSLYNTIAKINSISLGQMAYAENNSYNFYGDSAINYSFCVGKHGLVANHTTALGTYNEPKFVSGDNPYTFALGDGTKDNPHTYFRVDGNGVFYSKGIGHEIDLTKNVESDTIICSTMEEYEIERRKTENAHKVFIVG